MSESKTAVICRFFYVRPFQFKTPAVSTFQALNLAGMEEGKDAADRKDKLKPQDEQQELIHHVKPDDVSEVLDCAEDVVHAQ